MKRRKIGNLERQSISENPNWIPQTGEYYAWRESNTRHGDLFIRRVIAYDSEGKIVKGRILNTMMESRHLSGIFRLPDSEVGSDIEL